MTVVQPLGRFGALDLGKEDVVRGFYEKPSGDRFWVNGGFFVAQPELFDYLWGDDTILEKMPFEQLTRDGQMVAYKHSGFWCPLDTQRDRVQLEKLWNSGKAPWKVWD